MAAQSRGAWVSASGKRRFIPTSLPSGGSTSIPTVRTTPNGKKNPVIAAETLRRAGAMRKERFQVPTSQPVVEDQIRAPVHRFRNTGGSRVLLLLQYGEEAPGPKEVSQ